jgi:hypothetical protein
MAIMRGVVRALWRVVVIVSAIFLGFSLVGLALIWFAPLTYAGRIAENMLSMRILPRWLTGPYDVTGRHYTFISIGVKTIAVLAFCGFAAYRKLRRRP